MIEDINRGAGLDLCEAVPLAYALVTRVASDAGVRALGIKGPTLRALGVDIGKESIDVDFLVDPAQLATFERRLVAAGWASLKVYDYASIVPQHSINMEHPGWPCELDLHHQFPGFLADSPQVFDYLWQRRSTIEVAGCPVDVVDVVAHVALTALHCLRNPDGPRRREHLATLAGAVFAWPTHRRDELGEVARLTGATHTLRPFLDQVGCAAREPAAPADECRCLSAEELDWDMHVRLGGQPVVAWLFQLGRRPWRQRPQLLWTAIRLGEQAKRPREGWAARQPGSAGWRANLERLRRAVASTPVALNALRVDKTLRG